MLVININDNLRIISTEHAWETQNYKAYGSGTKRWEFFAHHTTIISAFINTRESLIRESNCECLYEATTRVESLLRNSIRAHTAFIQTLIYEKGHHKIRHLINDPKLRGILIG
ncbi:hypothetical protein OAH83_00210 [Methylophilaceae bacterium]|nr:hypothetical protein [Methylophilaceae bacterium]